MAYETVMLNRHLPDYYKNLFPFKPYTQWLCYQAKPLEYFARREFAFILEDDVHIRYRSFIEPHHFEQELINRSPHKLDLGAVYNHFPKDRQMYSDFKAVERELVFDIDLTDYDTVRHCCSDAKVCEKCWKFVALAVKILDSLLEDNFGFKARMWVFSGRRGVHCWIGDEKARKMNNIGRASVADYLSLIVSEKLEVNGNKKVARCVHPMVESAYRIAMDSGIIDAMITEQGWLEEEHLDDVLLHITTPDLRENVREKLSSLKPTDRWIILKRWFDSEERKAASIKGISLPSVAPEADRNFLIWFVLYHAYPRLDVNVSTGVNHLLKSPFCIHPKTGNVAVPLNVSNIQSFDVHNCPRIDKLLIELKKFESEGEDIKENRKILGYKHTSLATFVNNFEAFVELACKS